MKSDTYESFEPDQWNACLQVLSSSLDSLDSVQRSAARVFEYYGHVMNGGHSLHFDVVRTIFQRRNGTQIRDYGGKCDPLRRWKMESGAVRFYRYVTPTVFCSA